VKCRLDGWTNVASAAAERKEARSMKGILAFGGVAAALTFLLLLFRQWLFKSREHQQRCYPVYLILFDDGDWDLNSNTMEDLPDPTRGSVMRIKLPTKIITFDIRFKNKSGKKSASQTTVDRTGKKIGLIALFATLFTASQVVKAQIPSPVNPSLQTATTRSADQHKDAGQKESGSTVEPADSSKPVASSTSGNSINAQTAAPPIVSLNDSLVARKLPSESRQTQQTDRKWQYGGFADIGYLLDFNHPANQIFRSRGTTWHTDNVYLNMAGAYLRKKATENSRWGLELTAQAGKDTEVFGFSATAPNIPGFKWLRHLGPTNVSYLAPIGKGLTLQGGIFASLIGYDSLYSKDNFNYTRPWGADFTPYFMMGVNASYPFTEKITGTFFLINGYWHLANANGVPSFGGQVAYKATPSVTVKETVLFGPHQSNTSSKFWRFLSDSIVEHKTDRVTFAFEYIASTEQVDAPGSPRALMMASQLPVHWAINKKWSLSVRPEVFWDRDGRWTLARQTVKALTTTLEYRIPYKQFNTILRLEHRIDDSRGRDGGFFRGAEIAPGVVGLTPNQHLLVFATIFTFDH